MFEHLDDPAPFRPDDRLRQAVGARGRRLRRRRRITAALASVTLVVGGAGGAGLLYVDRRDAAIDRTRIATEPSLDGATNVLVVGTDTGLPRDVEGIRADTVAVVRVRPDGTVGVLSLPRDLVDPDTGDRLGATRAGGIQALVDAVDRLTGIPVDHYVELDMAGFAELVDEAGGLRLAVDVPLRDDRSGLALQPSPCATLDGEAALALVRSRYLQTLGPDGWHSDTTGDLGRMSRTQAVATAAVTALAGIDATPGEIDRLTRVLADHATVDDGLGLADMAELARAVAGAGPSGVDAVTVPIVERGDGATVALGPGADAVFAEYGAEARPAAENPGSAGNTGNADAQAPAGPDDPPGFVPLRPC